MKKICEKSLNCREQLLGNLKQIYYYNEKAKTENKESHDQFYSILYCLKAFYRSFVV